MIKRTISLAVIAALLTMTVGTYHHTEAKAAPQLLTGVLSKMQTAHRGLRSMRASMVQQRRNPQIGSTETDYGTFLYKPGGRGKSKLRIDYTRPDQKSVSVVGENLTFYQPRINQVLKTTLSKAAKGKTSSYSALVGLDSSLESLTKDYNVEYVKDELVGGKPTTRLLLVPKTGSTFSKIELWVSNEFWLPVQYQMFERNGDSTLVKFTGMEINPSLADSLFNVNVPSGTKVVDKI
jgi:outer membrane lipoprotein carrier protein